MQINSRTRGSRILALFVCLFLILSGFQPADAAERQTDNQTVKAGIFYLEGYHMKDEAGNLTGYGIDFLDLVSEYSHLNFEYTGYDKPEKELLTMLKNGEIDVLTLARKTSGKEERFAYSLPIGITHTILAVREDDDRFYSGDYRSYDGITVGAAAGSSHTKKLVDFAKDKNFSFTVREYEDSEQLAAALADGSIDAVLSSDLRRSENEKTLDTIASENFYAIVRKEDTHLLDELNYAIEQMHINEGDWSNELFYKYYGTVHSSELKFNKREMEYIQDVLAGKKTITVTAMGDRNPYSFVEKGRLQGIQPDYFAKIMEMAGLPYETVVPKDREDYYNLADTNGVDVVIDTRNAEAPSENDIYRGFYTDAYMMAGVAKVTRNDFKGEVSTVAIAEDQGNVPLEQGLLENVGVLKYTTREEALQAVLDGKADAAYVYTYTAQMFVNKDLTASLNYSIINGIRFDFRMYVRNSSDHELVTILNKCIQQMPEDTLNQLVAAYTSYTPGDMTFVQYLQVNPASMAAVILLSALGIGIILVLSLRARWNRKILAATERSKEELEAQFAIVDALSRDYIVVLAVNVKEAVSRVIKMKDYAAEVLQVEGSGEFSYDALMEKNIKGYVHPKDQQYLTKALSLDMVMQKLEEADEYSGSFRVMEGEEIHNFQFTFVKAEGVSQEHGHMILSGFRNIDDMVRREQKQKEALAEALAEAQHANHAKTIFLNNMSHDIRTPMNAIIGFTSLAASHVENKDQVRNYLDKIMTSSRHLLSLINDVLDMSRIESGKVTIDEKEASLPEIMHDLKTIVQSDVKAKQLDFSIDTVDVTNETIFCDKLRLNQVLLNILSNAMKYTKPGGMVSVRIIQRKDAEEGYALYQFHVKDTGMGMSREFQKHLFEPFEREQNSTVSGIQGTGLGLAITKNIVDMMHGTITVESEEGKGSEFIVSFRFRTAGDPEETEELKDLAGQRALVVDDDINTCMSVSKMLSSIGMHPDWTTQGKEAVARAEFALEQKEPYHTYIIDWLMPNVNGVEIVRRIRKVIGDAPGGIILLTAYDWADVEEEAKEAGVTAFCSKPVFLSELRRILAAPIMIQEVHAEETTPEELFRGKKILLVEDNEVNQEIAKAILEEAGFVLDIADDGSVAVEIMEKAPEDAYDLILMDIQMIRMNGYDATRAIRAMEDPVKSRIPIVAMTANAFEEDRQLALEAGMNGHVAKPIDVEQLMDTLKDILKRKNV